MWCQNWYLTLREGHGLRMDEKKVLRKIVGPKRKEICERPEKNAY
jgi:hypothetical protein